MARPKKTKRARVSESPAPSPGEARSPVPSASPGVPDKKKREIVLGKTRARRRGPPRASELRAARIPKPEEIATGGKPAAEWLKACVGKIDEADKREAAVAAEVARLVERDARKKGVIAGAIGRPTKYEEWMCEAVVEFGAQGMEVVEFAVALRVCRDSLYEWADKHPAFSDALKRAREASEAWHIKNIRNQAQLPGPSTNLPGYLGYMRARYVGWREPQENRASVPVSAALASGRKRVEALAAEREEATRVAGA